MLNAPPLLSRLDNLQQTKARLELSNLTLKQQHGKELEGREEELEQVKVTLNKKLKSLGQQLDDVHEEKQSAVKVSFSNQMSFTLHWIT